MLELGLDTFGDVTAESNGAPKSHAQVIRDLVEEGLVADVSGVDFIGIGEHHRPDFAASTPETILAAIAARTSRIRLGSAVTVLSSDDPIRVFQRFATLDAISNGRAEVIVGRGSFTESFPLFGFDLGDYERLFNEKLDLFAALLKGPQIHWQGSTRPPLSGQGVYPQPEGKLRTWVGVGGTPQSALRAAHYGLPMLLAIIGGDPARYLPLADLYRHVFRERGEAPADIGIHSHGYVSETDEQAREELWPGYKVMMDRIGGERGWPPLRKDAFIREIEQGSLYVGSSETVARKIAKVAKAFGLARFQMKYSGGLDRHQQFVGCIERFGTRVIPMVRDILAG